MIVLLKNFIDFILNTATWYYILVSILGVAVALWIATKSRSKAVQSWRRKTLVISAGAVLLVSLLCGGLQTAGTILQSLQSSTNLSSQSNTPPTFQITPSSTETTPSPANPILSRTDQTATTTAQAQGIYEAEDPQNTLTGHAYIDQCPECSGKRIVFNIGISPKPSTPDPTDTIPYDGTLQFNSVQVPNSGIYTLTIFYCDHFVFDTAVYISVNKEADIDLHESSAGDCFKKGITLGQVSLSIDLHAGNNTVKFANHYGPSSAIDKITIQKT